MKMKD